jgi:chromosome segregation ATPase
MPESNEQGLVERLRADVEEQHTMGEPISGWLVEEAAAALEAQSAQIAELQAEVERLRAVGVRWLNEFDGKHALMLEWKDRATAAEAQIADIKRALDTARHDAMEEAKRVADRYAAEPDPDEDDPYDDYGMGSRSTARCISRDIAALGSASPLSQGGQE